MNKLRSILMIMLAVGIVSCSSNVNNDTYSSNKSSNRNYNSKLPDPLYMLAVLNQQQKEWEHTPYRLGGLSKSGIDCSGFVNVTYKNLFNINLPRTTKDLASQGKRISIKDLSPGDLIFFKSGRGPYGLHVGIYIKDDLFLHASSKGVIYSSYKEGYYKNKFWQVRRV